MYGLINDDNNNNVINDRNNNGFQNDLEFIVCTN